jgi:hypothetical protein
MKDDMKCEVNHFFNFHFKWFLDDHFKPKLVLFQTKNMFYYIMFPLFFKLNSNNLDNISFVKIKI